MRLMAHVVALGLAGALLAGCGASKPTQAADQTPKADAGRVTASGLKITDYKIGTGPEAMVGRKVSVHYTGWLENGTKFDSSVDRGQPFEFGLGQGSVIKGWDEGVQGMKVGGKRQLVIPSALGYGPNGAGGVIPPNATLVFDVELLGVK
jgi:FKBP-type peptidyl-prolyl cis-trans isomerase